MSLWIATGARDSANPSSWMRDHPASGRPGG
jgi:hypothetical protein